MGFSIIGVRVGVTPTCAAQKAPEYTREIKTF